MIPRPWSAAIHLVFLFAYELGLHICLCLALSNILLNNSPEHSPPQIPKSTPSPWMIWWMMCSSSMQKNLLYQILDVPWGALLPWSSLQCCDLPCISHCPQGCWCPFAFPFPRATWPRTVLFHGHSGAARLRRTSIHRPWKWTLRWTPWALWVPLLGVFVSSFWS